MPFKNLKDLLVKFSDENVCRAYYEQMRWNGNVECPFCACTKVYKIESGKRFKCADRNCYRRFSITTGTIFENSKIPLSTWFAAIYLTTAHKKGISSCQLARDLGITQKTAWFVLHRIREMAKEKAPQILRNTVEVDETYVGGKNKNRHASKKIEGSRGRSKDKTPVIGLLERNSNVKTFVVPDTEAATIQPIVLANIEPQALVITDSYRSYYGLDKTYNHAVVKAVDGNFKTEGYLHTNSIEGFWANLKRGYIGIYHYMSPKHLQRYCDEFTYRYNTRRVKDNVRFELSLQKVEGRLKWNDLIGVKR